MREIQWRLNAITKRQNYFYEFNAGIHGVKLDGSKKKENVKELTEKQQTAIDNANNERVKQWQMKK